MYTLASLDFPSEVKKQVAISTELPVLIRGEQDGVSLLCGCEAARVVYQLRQLVRWASRASVADQPWFLTPVSRLDRKAQPESLGAAAAHALQLHGSSRSSSSRGSRRNSRAGSGRFLQSQQNVSGAMFSRNGSPESFRALQWNPLATFGGQIGDYIVSASDSTSSPSITIVSSQDGCLSASFSTVSNTPEKNLSSGVGEDSQTASARGSPFDISFSTILPTVFLSKSSSSVPRLTRQTSDSRIHGLENNHISDWRREARHSFRWSRSSGGDSSLGSGASVSDRWSMQTFSDLIASSQREQLRWNCANSPSDFGWGSSRENNDPGGCLIMERIHAAQPSAVPRAEMPACGVCSRLLKQHSPWSPYKMLATTDCIVVGVLECGHVYHAECLEQSTPEHRRLDPPCPQCEAAQKTAQCPLSAVDLEILAKGY